MGIINISLLLTVSSEWTANTNCGLFFHGTEKVFINTSKDIF